MGPVAIAFWPRVCPRRAACGAALRAGASPTCRVPCATRRVPHLEAVLVGRACGRHNDLVLVLNQRPAGSGNNTRTPWGRVQHGGTRLQMQSRTPDRLLEIPLAAGGGCCSSAVPKQPPNRPSQVADTPLCMNWQSLVRGLPDLVAHGLGIQVGLELVLGEAGACVPRAAYTRACVNGSGSPGSFGRALAEPPAPAQG